MGLEQIRSCRLLRNNIFTTVEGIDKRTNKAYSVVLLTTEYDEWRRGIPLTYAAPQLSNEDKNFLNYGVCKMVAATSSQSVVDYMVEELGFLPARAKELTDKHNAIVEKGIKLLNPPWGIADEVVTAEESRIGEPLSEDYYANLDD